MKRNKRSQNRRRELVKASVEDPKAGAALVHAFSKRLYKARGTSATVTILAELLGVSETTVFRDYAD